MTITVADALARLGAAQESGALAEMCRRFGVEILVLFGSAAQEEATHPPGDIDIAVGFDHGAPRDVLGVIDALSALVPGDHVDIMDLDRAGPVAQKAAMFGSRVLYAVNASVVTEREIKAFMMYEDTRWLRALQTEALQ